MSSYSQSDPRPAQTLIHCDGLGVSRDGTQILRSVDMSIDAGQIVAVVGPNGAGKTTLLRVLAGLMSPSSGTCQVCGLEPWGHRRQLAGQAGYCPEEDWLYDHLTVLGNLTYLATLKGVPPTVAAGALADILNGLHLVPLANVSLAKLSAGWRRRVAVAAAFLHRPQVIVLDEPLREVDVEGAEAICARVREFASDGSCCVVATQDIAQAERFGPLLVLDRGAIVFTGSAAQLLGAMSRRPVLNVRPAADEVIARTLREQHGALVRQGADGSRVVVPSSDKVGVVRSVLSQAGCQASPTEVTLADAYLWVVSHHQPTGGRV